MQRYSKILTITGRGFAPPPLKKNTGNNHANIKNSTNENVSTTV